MGMQWVVVADSNRARIFQTGGNLEHLQEVEDLLNPEGRMDDAELRHDAKGRFFGKGESHQAHTAEPNVTRGAHDAEQFSHEIGRMLAAACDASRYDSLVVVAPPDFLGRLRRALPERVARCVSRQLDHEITSWDGAQVRAYLKQALHRN